VLGERLKGATDEVLITHLCDHSYVQATSISGSNISYKVHIDMLRRKPEAPFDPKYMVGQTVLLNVIPPGVREVIICYHDECACHGNEKVKVGWLFRGKCGSIKDKSRGPLRMVAAFMARRKTWYIPD